MVAAVQLGIPRQEICNISPGRRAASWSLLFCSQAFHKVRTVIRPCAALSELRNAAVTMPWGDSKLNSFL